MMDDMEDQIKQWKKTGAEIIVGVDANAAIDEDRFGEMVAHQGLIDLVAMQHGQESPETFMKRTKTINFMLGTKGATKAVYRLGCFAHNDGIVSDH